MARTPSYQKINYSLRPAKSIERKMLAEAFRRLSVFKPIHNYRYVGFGSNAFSDFALFHRLLGISEMVSIEADKKNEKRFIFNKPYGHIKLEMGLSTEVLPRIQHNMETIYWLDYDGKLDSTVLADLTFLCTTISSGSLVLITVNARPDDPPDSDDQNNSTQVTRRSLLEESIGKENVPITARESDFAPKNFPNLCLTIVRNKIDQIISERNGAAKPYEEIEYKQLFYFHYNDGVKMLTAGFLFYKAEHESLVSAANFSELPFVKHGEEPYVIDVPVLTRREIRYWESQIPLDEEKLADTFGIPPKDIQQFEQLYRFYPHFTEADI